MYIQQMHKQTQQPDLRKPNLSGPFPAQIGGPRSTPARSRAAAAAAAAEAACRLLSTGVHNLAKTCPSVHQRGPEDREVKGDLLVLKHRPDLDN